MSIRHIYKTINPRYFVCIIWICITVNILNSVNNNRNNVIIPFSRNNTNEEFQNDFASVEISNDKFIIKYTRDGEFDENKQNQILGYFKNIEIASSLISNMDYMLMETLRDALGNRTKVIST